MNSNRNKTPHATTNLFPRNNGLIIKLFAFTVFCQCQIHITRSLANQSIGWTSTQSMSFPQELNDNSSCYMCCLNQGALCILLI